MSKVSIIVCILHRQKRRVSSGGEIEFQQAWRQRQSCACSSKLSVPSSVSSGHDGNSKFKCEDRIHSAGVV